MVEQHSLTDEVAKLSQCIGAAYIIASFAIIMVLGENKPDIIAVESLNVCRMNIVTFADKPAFAQSITHSTFVSRMAYVENVHQTYGRRIGNNGVHKRNLYGQNDRKSFD